MSPTPTAVFSGMVPRHGPLPSGDMHSFWFVLPAREFWVSSSMYEFVLIAFNLSSNAYFSVSNQYKGRKLKQLRTVLVTISCINASRDSATTTPAGQ